VRRRDGRVVIVGAGIVGAACAWAFAIEGFDVVVIEPRLVGGGATAAGMGHVVVMDDSEAQFALTRYSQQLWAALAPSLPGAADVDRCGTIWVAADEEELEQVDGKRTYYQERDVPVEPLDGEKLARYEPNLRPGLAGGLRVPEDGVVYAPVVAAWLIEQAGQRGATIRLGATVAELEGARVTLEDGEKIACDLAVNAAGTGAARLTPSLAIRPRKGHLVITDRYPRFVRHQLVELGYLKSAHESEEDSVAFNVQPRPTGQLLIGSSRQFAEETADVDLAILRRMVRRAIEFLPGLAGLTALRVWTGFRAATPDKLPLIGPYPGQPGLYLATGHEGLGITTSLGTARLLVDCVLGRPTAIPLMPYLPARVVAGVSHA